MGTTDERAAVTAHDEGVENVLENYVAQAASQAGSAGVTSTVNVGGSVPPPPPGAPRATPSTTPVVTGDDGRTGRTLAGPMPPALRPTAVAMAVVPAIAEPPQAAGHSEPLVAPMPSAKALQQGTAVVAPLPYDSGSPGNNGTRRRRFGAVALIALGALGMLVLVGHKGNDKPAPAAEQQAKVEEVAPEKAPAQPAAEPPQQPLDEVVAAPELEKGEVLRRGYRHDDRGEARSNPEKIQKFERALAKVLGEDIAVDGSFGPELSRKVAKFQKLAGGYAAAERGDVGRGTIAALREALEKGTIVAKPAPVRRQTTVAAKPTRLNKAEWTPVDELDDAAAPAAPTPPSALPAPAPSPVDIVDTERAKRELVRAKKEFENALAALKADVRSFEKEVHAARVVADSNAALTGARSTFAWGDAEQVNATEQIAGFRAKHQIDARKAAYEVAHQLATGERLDVSSLVDEALRVRIY